MVNATRINDLDELYAVQLRELVRGLIERAGHQQRVIEAHDRIVATKDREIHFKQTRVDQLTHEIAMLRRWKFAARSERLNAEQRSLLDETLDADIAAIEQELEQLAPVADAGRTKQTPRRAPLPAHLPRTEVHHEPESTTSPRVGPASTLGTASGTGAALWCATTSAATRPASRWA